jgi:ceramide glucosyltransferase
MTCGIFVKYVYYIFAGLLVWFSFKSLLGGIDYLRYFRERLARPLPTDPPAGAVIVPCRGLDQGLFDNLAALVRQSHPSYEVMFVVDSERDEAVPVINDVIAISDVPARLVIGDRSTTSSQKIANQLAGVAAVSADVEVLVFADSDARPGENWLSYLTEPLKDESVGAATGYRWFISPDPTFASELRSGWNASIASALGRNTSGNFCWGGSMAIRRDVFALIGVADAWKNGLSDDFLVTRCVKAAGLPIVFVPQALIASVENCTFREMLEFTTRQMKITRVYATHLWLMSFVGSGLFLLVMITSLAIATFRQVNDRTVIVAVSVFTIVCLFSVGKSYLRLKAVRLALPRYKDALKRQAFWQYTLFLVAPLIFFGNCIAALISRRLSWRGIEYELKSPSETVIISVSEVPLD